ncbi:MAG: endonuclease/exonuclease/phosphatase family protein [Moraxella sp.]|nr:endonuclease/exonuclease/phosphatase family protein [Moraxella sp.]
MTAALTITSYNIHKGMSPLNRLVQLGKMGQALSGLNTDILCLQEVQGQNLKRAMAYNEYPDEAQHAWFGEYLQLASDYGKNAEYQHGHHGNAVLSRHPLDPKHNVNITVNYLEKRGVLHCEIHPKGWEKSVVVLCCHLNLLHKDRLKQYAAIKDYIYHEIDEQQPLILAGDFNDWTKKSSGILAKLGLVEAFEAVYGKTPATFPAKLPLLSLDRIYVKNLVVKNAIVHAGIPWSDLSDHLPISAVLLPADT